MHPSGHPAALIEYERLLRAIAKHCYPDPVDLPDLPGVVGKRLLDPGTKLWRNTAPLTAEDQTHLLELISKHAGASAGTLPALGSVLGRKEILTFRRAFRKLQGRPDWEPVLRSSADRWLLHSARGDVYLRHDAALKKEIAEGHLRHFDGDRIRTGPHFQLITYLIREEAEAYLKQVGLDLHILLSGVTQTPAPTTSTVKQVSQTATSCAVINPEKRNRYIWSPERRHRLVEARRSGELDAIASEFGIPLVYAKQLASRFDREGVERLRAAPTSPLVRTPVDAASAFPFATPSSDNPYKTSPATSTVRGHSPDLVSFSSLALTPPGSSTQSQASLRLMSDRNFLLRMPEVELRVGLKRSTIYDRMNPRSKYYDPSFPRPVSLGTSSAENNENRRNGSAIGFYEDEIEKWLAGRPKR